MAGSVGVATAAGAVFVDEVGPIFRQCHGAREPAAVVTMSEAGGVNKPLTVETRDLILSGLPLARG